jgi:hypothetical protein
LSPRHQPVGNSRAALACGIARSWRAYLAVITAAMLILPPVNEVPSNFSATTLWDFRLASLGIEAVFWIALGLAFGLFAERQLIAASWSARNTR